MKKYPLVIALLLAVTVVASQNDQSTQVGSITFFGDTYEITRTMGGASGQFLTFIGTHGRDIATYPNTPFTMAGAFPQIPEDSRIAICGPCPLLTEPGNVGAFIGVADDGGQSDGSVIVSAYQPEGPSLTVQMNQVPEPKDSPSWSGDATQYGYYVYYGFDAYGHAIFLLKDVGQVPPYKSHASTPYDPIYGRYWSELSDHQGLVSIVPVMPPSDGVTWDPNNPPASFDVIITLHPVAGVWTSQAPLLNEVPAQATEESTSETAEGQVVPADDQEQSAPMDISEVPEVQPVVSAPGEIPRSEPERRMPVALPVEPQAPIAVPEETMELAVEETPLISSEKEVEQSVSLEEEPFVMENEKDQNVWTKLASFFKGLV